MITDVSAVRTHVPARDDTSSEVVISVSLFKVHFVRHSGVSLCLCVVSLSWIDDDWSSAFVLFRSFQCLRLGVSCLFVLSVSCGGPSTLCPHVSPLALRFVSVVVRLVQCLKSRSLSLSCVSCFILKVPGPVCYVTLLWCLPSVLCAL